MKGPDGRYGIGLCSRWVQLSHFTSRQIRGPFTFFLSKSWTLSSNIVNCGPRSTLLRRSSENQLSKDLGRRSFPSWFTPVSSECLNRFCSFVYFLFCFRLERHVSKRLFLTQLHSVRVIHGSFPSILLGWLLVYKNLGGVDSPLWLICITFLRHLYEDFVFILFIFTNRSFFDVQR